MENSLDHIHLQALKELDAVENTDDLQDISVRYLGRKGILTRFLRNISKLPVEQRPAAVKNTLIPKNYINFDTFSRYVCNDAIWKINS